MGDSEKLENNYQVLLVGSPHDELCSIWQEMGIFQSCMSELEELHFIPGIHEPKYKHYLSHRPRKSMT